VKKLQKTTLRSLKHFVAGAAVILALGVTQAHAADDFTAAQKEALGTIIDDYIMKNPEVLINALNSYQQKQAEAEQAKRREGLVTKKAEIYAATTPFGGNAKGDVTIVEFFDYNCGYCHKALEDVKRLIDSDKNVKVLLKDMPILGESSMEISRWALAAQKQGKYYEYHVALMTSQEQKTPETLEKIAKSVGLDTVKLRKDATEDKSIQAQLDANIALAQSLGIGGTPAFIIGDDLVPGFMGYDNMVAAIKAVREKK